MNIPTFLICRFYIKIKQYFIQCSNSTQLIFKTYCLLRPKTCGAWCVTAKMTDAGLEIKSKVKAPRFPDFWCEVKLVEFSRR